MVIAQTSTLYFASCVFSYHGIKLDRMQGKKRHHTVGGVNISTVYDEKDDSDSLLRLQGPATLKYRKVVGFKSGRTEKSGSQ